MQPAGRIVKRKALELLLTKVKPHPKPSLPKEQYTTPPQVAATMLHMAAYCFDDIQDKTVCDLGCGSGILAIATVCLGAAEVVGIDIDRLAIQTAKRNAEALGIKVQWVVGDIDALRGEFDTAVENPPFGVHRHGADIRFLQKAMSIAETVYSIHKTGTAGRNFIGKLVEKRGGEVTSIIETKLAIPHQFNFHRKPIYRVKVDIYRIKKKEE